MSTIKLSQVVAIEKNVKARVYSEVTELHKLCQKSDPLTGFVKTYEKAKDDGLDLPPETKRVAAIASEVIDRVSERLTELFDIEATKDYGNCQAFADVEVLGQVLIARCPVPYLLFLDKQLTDLRTFVSSIVVLDDSHDWDLDQKSNLWKAQPIRTHRTEKVQEALVLYNATDKHPAQTQLITRDVIVGHWKTVHFSGAIPRTRRMILLERIDTLAKAVKSAAAEANTTKVDRQQVGAAVFSYLFA